MGVSKADIKYKYKVRRCERLCTCVPVCAPVHPCPLSVARST